jgi:hypothetical protein
MGLLHKMQQRPKTVALQEDMGGATKKTAEDVSDAQNKIKTGVIAETSAGESSSTANSKTSSSVSQPTPATTQGSSGGANNSTVKYEGLILSYLEDYEINQGAAATPEEKEQNQETETKKVIQSEPEATEPSSNTLAGQTSEEKQQPDWEKILVVGGVEEGLTSVGSAPNILNEVPNMAYWKASGAAASDILIKNGVNLGQQGATVPPKKNTEPSLPVIPPSESGIVVKISGNKTEVITPSDTSQGVFVWPGTVSSGKNKL